MSLLKSLLFFLPLYRKVCFFFHFIEEFALFLTTLYKSLLFFAVFFNTLYQKFGILFSFLNTPCNLNGTMKPQY